MKRFGTTARVLMSTRALADLSAAPARLCRRSPPTATARTSTPGAGAATSSTAAVRGSDPDRLDGDGDGIACDRCLVPAAAAAARHRSSRARPDHPRAGHRRGRRRHDPRQAARGDPSDALHRAADRHRHARGLRRRRVRRPPRLRLMKRLAPAAVACGCAPTRRKTPSTATTGCSPTPSSRRARPGVAQAARRLGEVYVYGGNPFQRVRAFRQAQRSAKGGRRGVWGRCRREVPQAGLTRRARPSRPRKPRRCSDHVFGRRFERHQA